MTDLFLIAHKVRGEPAFDVAVRMACPECATQIEPGCGECDFTTFWWIIPTSGHRAYPWDSITLDNASKLWLSELPEMPPSLPDHYNTTASPSRPPLTSLLPAPAPVRIQRRF